MTRPIVKTDLEEIYDFLAEYEASETDIDTLEDDASIDRLINQLEASFETVTQLTNETQSSEEGLRDLVRNLAQRLEDIATELTQINLQLNP